MSPRRARAIVVALVAAVALTAVQAAFAESPVIRFTADDQAAAKASLLKLSDLGAGWKAVRRSPTSPTTPNAPATTRSSPTSS